MPKLLLLIVPLLCGFTQPETCNLSADVDGVSIRTGGTQTLVLSSKVNPEAPYWLLGTTAGTGTGIDFAPEFGPAFHMDLNPDGDQGLLVYSMYRSNGRLLENSRSFLDKNGEAAIRFVVPRIDDDPSLIGIVCHFQAFVVTDNGQVGVTNTVPCKVLP